MKARRRPDGSLMNVGINFVISWDGLIWQTADLLTATTHVGLGPVNAASVGVEVCNPGTGKQMRALGYDLPTHEVRIAGRRVEVVTPPQAVFDTWEALVELLCSLTGQFEGVNIPRVTLSDKTKRLSRAEAIRTKGVLEHCNLPGTKIDAGGLLAGCLTF